MFLAAAGYSADVIREKSKSIRAVNLSHNYDFATVPTKPNDATSAINLARITNRQCHPGNSQTSSLTDTSFTRPMLIDVIETLLASNDNSCVHFGFDLLNSITVSNFGKLQNSQDFHYESAFGHLDIPTIDRMKKIILHQVNNPLLESTNQTDLLPSFKHSIYFERKMIGNDWQPKSDMQSSVTASEAEQLWQMRNTESPYKLGQIIIDYMGCPISNPNNKNEMGFGVFQRDPWQAWTQEMIKAPSPKLRLIWAVAIDLRILNLGERYFDFSGAPQTYVINKLSDEAKLAEWKTFTLAVITKGEFDVPTAIEFLHDYDQSILDSMLCPILWANMKEIADSEKTTQSDPKIYQTWLTALRWCTRNQYDALITMENVAKDLGSILSEQDYRTNGYSMAMVNCLKEIHNPVVVTKK